LKEINIKLEQRSKERKMEQSEGRDKGKKERIIKNNVGNRKIKEVKEGKRKHEERNETKLEGCASWKKQRGPLAAARLWTSIDSQAAYYPFLLHDRNPPPTQPLVPASNMSTRPFTYSYARAYMRFCL
jgi:hypothetical protein